MGDADSEIIVPINEIESWMDEALGVVDEGLDHLFLYMMNVNDRTKQILKKLESLEYFKRLIMAMHVLAVPVVISVLLCYSLRNTVDVYGLEVYFQLVVTILMLLSGSLGLPLYFYSLWKLYSVDKGIKNDLVGIRRCVPRTSSGKLDSASLSEDSFLTFISNEASLERLNNFSRMLTHRMPGGMRTDIGDRSGFRFYDPNEERPEMRVISMLMESSSNPSSEGMFAGDSSETEFEFQETEESVSDSEVIEDKSNEALRSKFGSVVVRDAEKTPPRRKSNQDVESDKNLEPNLKEKSDSSKNL